MFKERRAITRFVTAHAYPRADRTQKVGVAPRGRHTGKQEDMARRILRTLPLAPTRVYRGEFCRSMCSTVSTTPTTTSAFSLRSHTCGELRRDHVGESVSIYGWLGKPRVNKVQGIAFLPVHDTTGVTQFVCQLAEWQHLFDSFTAKERVVKVSGVVKPRPEEAVNTNQPTGEIEVEVTSLEVINEATHSPFATFGGSPSEKKVSLEHQLRERPHYLRLPHMQRNLRLRSEVAMTLREFLVRRHGFLEVETPTLFRRTPEGAQEFIVPTRTPKKFFSLVQSPQQFKQLLMVAGVERYFQFARCYRDEDQRSDRQPEFTQVDLEMAFVDSNCVMRLTEELVSHAITSLCPQCSIPHTPFPRMKYRHAMELYGSDKPDIRYGMHLVDLKPVWTELLGEMGMEREKEEEGTSLNPYVFALKIPGWQGAMEEADKIDRTKAKETNKRIEELFKEHTMATITDDDAKSLQSLDNLLSTQFPFALLSLFSHLSPSLGERLAHKIAERVNLDKANGDVCIIATAERKERDRMLNGLGTWRSLAASILQLTEKLELDPTRLEFLWVVDFPLFSVDQKDNVFHVTSTHHPFTAPQVEDGEKLLGRWTPEELTQV